MIIDDLVSTNTLLISNALLAGAAAIAILRFQCVTRQLANSDGIPVAAPPAESDQNEPQSQAVEDRILALQKIADELAQKEVMLQRHALHESPYENAVRMVKRGAGADELTRNCGLNKGEAQLLVRLHGRE